MGFLNLQEHKPTSIVNLLHISIYIPHWICFSKKPNTISQQGKEGEREGRKKDEKYFSYILLIADFGFWNNNNILNLKKRIRKLP
jgi:hypothetical protein